MIFCLMFFLLLFMYFSYWINQKVFFSAAFISTASFAIATCIYCVFINRIGKDISVDTFFIISSSLICLLLGECAGRRVYIGKRRKNKISDNRQFVQENGPFLVSTQTMFVFFAVYVLVFIIRFYDLYKFSIGIGNSRGILGTLATSRLAYSMGEYSSSNFLVDVSIYMTLCLEIIAYYYLFYFTYNVVFFKKKYKRLLLPILGYSLVAVSFTGRNQYIQIAIICVWFLIYLYYVRDKNINQKSNKKLLKVIIKISVSCIVLLFLYSFLTRNSDGSNLFDEVLSYMGSSIYGFDNYKDTDMYGVVAKKEAFGYYTMREIHSFFNTLFRTDYSVPAFRNLRFFSYKSGSSNIYTCLYFPYQDFGTVGVMITRVLLGFIIGVVERNLSKTYLFDSKGIVYMILLGIIYYDAISSYIADRYYGNILDPVSLCKYTVFSYIIVKLLGDIRKRNRNVKNG